MSENLKKRAIVAMCSLSAWYLAKANNTQDASPAVIIGGLLGWAVADSLVGTDGDAKTPDVAL